MSCTVSIIAISDGNNKWTRAALIWYIKALACSLSQTFVVDDSSTLYHKSEELRRNWIPVSVFTCQDNSDLLRGSGRHTYHPFYAELPPVPSIRFHVACQRDSNVKASEP